MSQAGKQVIAKRWIGKRKAMASSSQKSKRKATIYAVRSFTTTGPRLGAPLSPVLNAKMRVCSQQLLTGGASGAIATYSLYANSLNDPFSSVSAVQPRGYDQLAGTLYAKYRVKNVKVNVQFLGGNLTGGVVVGFQFTDSATPPSDFRAAIEQGFCVWQVMPADLSNTQSLTMTCDVAKFKGRSVTDDELAANFNGDPADLLYCHVFSQSLAAASSVTVNTLCTLDFDCQLFDPINVASS